jgi:hypothetical protein
LNDDHFWDMLVPELAQLFAEPWGEPVVGLSPRQTVATIFAMRALRRLMAVTDLFRAGLYLECHLLVRAAYEDWLQLAYVLREQGDARCREFGAGVHKHDARVYDAFRALCGQQNADRFFPNIPAEVSAFLGVPRSQTNPPSFASLADDVGLRKVHDFAYTYLSGRSHPDPNRRAIFDDSKSIGVARIPERDPSDEIRPALWFAWFTARIVVLAAREFGIDREPFCDEYLARIADDSGTNLETCVMVKEYAAP